jgi:hypothetical protein
MKVLESFCQPSIDFEPITCAYSHTSVFLTLRHPETLRTMSIELSPEDAQCIGRSLQRMAGDILQKGTT